MFAINILKPKGIKNNMRGNKKGVSPVIATVMLIAIVIVMGLIVFTWIQGIQEEAITKFGGQNVKLICEEVKFDASYSSGFLSIVNSGSIPIYKIQAKISGNGEHETILLGEEPGQAEWRAEGLSPGMDYATSLSSAGSEILLIPVLVGESGDTQKSHICDDRHGFDIVM